MTKDLEKRFNFKEVEEFYINLWEKHKTFQFKEEKDKKKFCIMMPPPNVTGSLHIGHALTFTLQDILVRFNKKLGLNVLWQPGVDHAGIATEIIVEQNLLKEKNLKKKEIGREKFLNEVWEWKKISGNKIIDQLKKLGTCVDWSMARFTLDEGLCESVNSVFVELYNKGLIYRDKKLINWDPVLETAVSDLEVKQKNIKGKLWFIKYKIFKSEEYIIVATTRPETIFGDTGIAIHPKNNKYKKFIGKEAEVPFCKRSVPIFADSYADPEKGSGIVKITPAHDFNDFLLGKKHKLKFINIFDKNAKLNKNVPSEFQGKDRYEARKIILQSLKEKKLIVKDEVNVMTIPVGDRTGTVIEPYLTEQWFVNSKELCREINASLKKKEISFVPPLWINTFKHWIKNIEPWCISRQIWWGHRIPVWYTNNGDVIVAKNLKEAEKKLKKINPDSKITHQDSDVLDTWFSSALWPFSTLGWPEKTQLFKKFYPTDVLVTGFDIIFFWVARMIMMGLQFTNSVPFKKIYIHPLVKDDKGEKMSKSKGNVIDPLELINLYGCDALRFTLTNLSTQGQDIKLSNKLVENSRNFITKLWNAARFSNFNKFSLSKNYSPNKNKLLINVWIIFRLYQTQEKVIKNLKNFKFNLISMDLYHFIWNDFCDLYIEFCKHYLTQQKNFEEISNTFSFVFKVILNLINPIIPFVTEKLSSDLNFSTQSLYDELIEIKKPKITKELSKGIKSFENLVDLLRKVRIELNKEKNPKSKLVVFSKIKVPWIEDNQNLIIKSFDIQEVLYSSRDEDMEKSGKSFIVAQVKFKLALELPIEVGNKENNKQIQFYKDEIIFFENKLNNINFVKKAPKKIIQEHKIKLENARRSLKLLSK